VGTHPKSFHQKNTNPKKQIKETAQAHWEKCSSTRFPISHRPPNRPLRNKKMKTLKFALLTLIASTPWLIFASTNVGYVAMPSKAPPKLSFFNAVAIDDLGKTVMIMHDQPYLQMGSTVIICVDQSKWKELLNIYADRVERTDISFMATPIKMERLGKVTLVCKPNNAWQKQLEQIVQKTDTWGYNAHHVYGNNCDPSAKEGDIGTLYYIPSNAPGIPCTWKLVKKK
jgi:hypothetical protein